MTHEMPHAPARTRLALLIAICAAVLGAGCGSDPGTSVRVKLGYDDHLGLDTAEVTLNDRVKSGSIEHEMLLVIPDELAGAPVRLEVWGRKMTLRAAYAATMVTPARGKTVTISLALDACTPGCQSDGSLTTCTSAAETCPLGCSDKGDAHCVGPRPSNGIDPAKVAALGGTTTVISPATFNTDTGEILGGGIDRPPGSDIDSPIVYFQAPPFDTGGAPLGVFAFHNLTIISGVSVGIIGSRAAVLLVGDIAQIDGTIDLTGGHNASDVGGPGGGKGGGSSPAQGCGPGMPGIHKLAMDDSGGGGGAAGGAGAEGGNGGTAAPGAGGLVCTAMLVEPLAGGSGGGAGGIGGSATIPVGGGGGGALQLTALTRLEINGTINAGGAGGAAGQAGSDSQSGGGGGAGGVILLEAPTVHVTSSAIIAANGGGGGGGGALAAAGQNGSPGGANLVPADGGGGGGDGGGGGTGGYGNMTSDSSPDVGIPGTTNGGGGGGSYGVIAVRSDAPLIDPARFSPGARVSASNRQ